MSLKDQSTIENNNAFLLKIEDLVKEILIQTGMPYYRIEGNIDQAPGSDSYHPVVRIITYFEDTVSKISNILSSEFEIEALQAPEKKGVSFDSFAAKRVQYLAGLKASRRSQTEYKRSAGKKFEIQICSMLQDAWVGIEKELGYENMTVPEDVKRDFYRVGALLEMADIEFLKIRSLLDKEDHTAAQQPQAAPAASFTEQLQSVAADAVVPAAEAANGTAGAHPIAPRSMDRNADSLNPPAMNISHSEEKKGNTGEPMTGIVNAAAADNATKQSEEATPVAAANEDRAVNINNDQPFNMHVNGMIEKTTETVREGAAENKAIPLLHEEPNTITAAVMDENAPMTDASLKEYVKNSKTLKDVDMQIAERAGAKLNPEIDIEGDVDRLKFLKVFTLKQLHERITDNAADIVGFAEKWIGKDNGGSFDSGICLFYLEYLLVGKRNDPAFAIEYVVKFISDNDYSARYIIPTYNSIRNAEPASSHAHLTLKS